MQDFFIHRHMPDSWKRTFVTLIPKWHDTSEPGYFRSIGLCNTLYKIYAKRMVVRMKPVLPCLISPKQGLLSVVIVFLIMSSLSGIYA